MLPTRAICTLFAVLIWAGCATDTVLQEETSCDGEKCDALETSGCEIEGYTQLEPNDAQPDAHALPRLNDDGELDVATALETADDIDWYVAEVTDAWWGDLQPMFWVRMDRAQATEMGAQVETCGYYFTDSGKNLAPDTCGNAEPVTDEYGSGCCSWPSAEIASVTMDVTSALRDDSGSLLVRVRRTDDAAGACLPYQLSFRL